ncbi:CHAD domain-containing protein [Sulfurimonas autotrophica]|uniref:CHAD domain containing protein n=1 Tax=Sulfurimonas autotrophica (strain ATCC BAA-671 / DSM 16294 / JCM 11897 / OK10) TaxID=563040 RepID=E0URZ7_SULAO|nr:CHAD domain-containing protein [Sulfurimonas autotrophica]ADN09020.1 CHAD domain containing protein [Sulfurimonas autotrophica DSM 16294]
MHATIEATFREFLEIDLKKVKKYEKAVLASKDTDALHQMRVSLRRMRSVFFTFQSVIPKKITKNIYANISTVASCYDKARDIDVYIETYLNKDALTSTELLLYNIALKCREKEYRKIKKYLESKKYKKFKKELKKWIKTKQWRKKLTKKQLSVLEENIIPFAANFLKSYQNDICLYGSAIGPVLEDEQAHKLRIKLKKLRYATELFTPYFQNRLDNLKKILKELQDILGQLHDIYITKKLHKIFLHFQQDKKLYAYIKKVELVNTYKKEKLKEAFFLKWKLFTKIVQSVC